MPFPAPRPGAGSLFTPFRLAFTLAALDGAWALQALASVPRHAGSNVALVSLAVWVVLHLPAAVLTGFLLRFAPGPALGLPAWSRVALGLLGTAQTFALVHWLARRRSKRA